MTESSDIFNIGAVCFGAVVGWITYRTLRRVDKAAISDIASVIGAVGGAAVLAIFDKGNSFGWYAIGLAGGFFGYFLVSLVLSPQATLGFMGATDGDGDGGGGGGVVRN
jgi:hypothetical protein